MLRYIAIALCASFILLYGYTIVSILMILPKSGVLITSFGLGAMAWDAVRHECKCIKDLF